MSSAEAMDCSRFAGRRPMKCLRISVRPIGTKMMPVTRRKVSTGAHARKIAPQSRKNTPAINAGHLELLIGFSFGAESGPGLLRQTDLVTCREPSQWVSERKSCRDGRIIEGTISLRRRPVEGSSTGHLLG